MRQIATIPFHDQETGRQGLIFLRLSKGTIALGLSVEKNGNLDIAMSVDEAEQLEKALRLTIETARRA